MGGFCPICGGSHDSSIRCTDSVGRVFKDMGFEVHKKKSKNFRFKWDEKSKRNLILLVLIAVTIWLLPQIIGFLQKLQHL